MNERLNTSDLAERLAYQTSIGKNNAEKFINTISDFIINGIETNKSVKIIGLGTFKVMLVRERESVHIQTGERFVIPAHHKLSFIPDKDMKDSINKPFAFLEPVEAENMPLSREIIDIEEEEFVEDVVEDMGVKTIVPEVVTRPEEEIASEDVSKPKISVAQEDEIEIKQQYYDIINPVISMDNESEEETNTTEQEPESQEVTVNSQTESYNENEANDKNISEIKKIPLWLWFVMLPLLIIIGVGIGTYAFLQFGTTGDVPNNSKEIIASATNIRNTQSPLPLGAKLLPDADGYVISDTLNTLDNSSATDSTLQQSVTNDTTSVNSTNTAKEVKPTINWIGDTAKDNKKEEPKPADKPNKETERKNRELAEKRKKAEDAKQTAAPKEKVIPGRVRMTQGSSLMQLALEHYGDKIFWVYIYEYNKSIIKNFDQIPLGTELRLPSTKTYGIDPNSQSSIDKAYKKQSELYKRDSWDEYVQ
ncbi:MAG: HU family DNA-binding protein [Tannerella sp.]|jgi:nucleoid DNA-binding protein|nr:HU family DNA-binding protein [Tannerella sp.]